MLLKKIVRLLESYLGMLPVARMRRSREMPTLFLDNAVGIVRKRPRAAARAHQHHSAAGRSGGSTEPRRAVGASRPDLT